MAHPFPILIKIIQLIHIFFEGEVWKFISNQEEEANDNLLDFNLIFYDIVEPIWLHNTSLVVS